MNLSLCMTATLAITHTVCCLPANSLAYAPFLLDQKHSRACSMPLTRLDKPSRLDPFVLITVLVYSLIVKSSRPLYQNYMCFLSIGPLSQQRCLESTRFATKTS